MQTVAHVTSFSTMSVWCVINPQVDNHYMTPTLNWLCTSTKDGQGKYPDAIPLQARPSHFRSVHTLCKVVHHSWLWSWYRFCLPSPIAFRVLFSQGSQLPSFRSTMKQVYNTAHHTCLHCSCCCIACLDLEREFFWYVWMLSWFVILCSDASY